MTNQVKNVGFNNARSVSAFVKAACGHVDKLASVHGMISADAEKCAALFAASGTATEPRIPADAFNTIYARYVEQFEPADARRMWNSFQRTAQEKTKARGFRFKAEKETANGLRYLAVNVFDYVAPEPKPEPEKETAKKETAPIASAVPAGADTTATETATGKHGADLMPRILRDALQRTGMSAAQLLAMVAGMVPVSELDAAMLALGYVSQDAAQDATDKAVKAAKAEKVTAARRRVAKRTGNK